MTDVIDTDSLESSVPSAVSHAKPALEFVLLDQIDLDAQVRTESGLDEESLQELAESVQANGILQPVLLRPNGGRFIVIAGERRCRAARLAGFSHVPALIGEADDGRAAAMQLIENVQRVDLSLLEIAAALRKLADEGKTLTEISQIVRKSKPWVWFSCNNLKLCVVKLSKFLLELQLSHTLFDSTNTPNVVTA